jgi:hypothetical protein
MSVKMRQIVEREITTAVVDALLAAGFSLSIDNGDTEAPYSKSRKNILKGMYQTDDEYLPFYDRTDDGPEAHVIRIERLNEFMDRADAHLSKFKAYKVL